MFIDVIAAFTALFATLITATSYVIYRRRQYRKTLPPVLSEKEKLTLEYMNTPDEDTLEKLALLEE